MTTESETTSVAQTEALAYLRVECERTAVQALLKLLDDRSEEELRYDAASELLDYAVERELHNVELLALETLRELAHGGRSGSARRYAAGRLLDHARHRKALEEDEADPLRHVQVPLRRSFPGDAGLRRT